MELLERAVYINNLRLKFKIKNDFGYYCANNFLSINIMSGLRVLQLIECSLTDDGMEQI
jgi:hypothetical protein